MIILSPNAAVTIYLGMTLLLLLGLWGYQHYKSRQKKIISSEQELYMCEYCHYVYLENQIKEINKCPQCQSFNQKNLYEKDK